MSKFSFFGVADKGIDGKIISEYPSWYYDRHIANLENSIKMREYHLERGLAHPEVKHDIIESVARDRKKLDEIKASIPKLTAAQKDKCYKEYKRISEVLRNALPSRYEMKVGLVDHHKEVAQITTPTFEVDLEIAEACNVKVEGGKVNRNQLSKIWKILGMYLGEYTNVEVLRRENMRSVA